MNKISSQDAASLLKQAGAAIRQTARERDVALAKVAAYERNSRVVKIAREMDEKGLSPDLTFEQKVAAVQKSQNLEVTEEAIKMAAPQSQLFGGLSDRPSAGAGAQEAFEHYITTGEDPTDE